MKEFPPAAAPPPLCVCVWNTAPIQQGVSKLGTAALEGPTSSKTLNHGGPLNVTHTGWFDIIPNGTHLKTYLKIGKNDDLWAHHSSG